MSHKLKVHLKLDGTGTVELDGKTIDTVAIGFNASVDERTEATLVIPCDVEVEADIDSAELRVVQRQQS